MLLLDTCAVDGRKFASGFSVVSKNALLCGGSNEISYDGTHAFCCILFYSNCILLFRGILFCTFLLHSIPSCSSTSLHSVVFVLFHYIPLYIFHSVFLVSAAFHSAVFFAVGHRGSRVVSVSTYPTALRTCVMLHA